MIEEMKRKNGRTTYRAKVRDRYGNWFPSEVRDRKVDAKRDEQDLIQLKRQGQTNADLNSRNMLLKDYWQQWYQTCLQKVSKGHSDDKLREFKQWIDPIIGGLPIQEVHATHINRILKNMDEMNL